MAKSTGVQPPNMPTATEIAGSFHTWLRSWQDQGASDERIDEALQEARDIPNPRARVEEANVLGGVNVARADARGAAADEPAPVEAPEQEEPKSKKSKKK